MKSTIENISDISIHAPARGATIRQQMRRLKHTNFNPRAREGRDEVGGDAVNLTDKFQSTRPRGARRSLPTLGRTKIGYFNPRAREGRDHRSNL